MRCVMCGHPPSDSCVIPRQNKDVCKDCDKATWLHTASVRGLPALAPASCCRCSCLLLPLLLLALDPRS